MRRSAPETVPAADAPAGAAPLDGLTDAQAAARLAAEGGNVLGDAKPHGLGVVVRDVVREPMFALLLGAGLLYLALGDLVEALMLLGFAMLSVALTAAQAWRTERVLDRLRDLASPRALVVRAGVHRRIPGSQVVRGDLLVVAEGDRVAADAVLRIAHDLQADESLLTGESVPVTKIAAAGSPPEMQPGGDGQPFVYAGSMIVHGQGLAQVMATGARSRIGRIGTALGAIAATAPPLQAQTRRLVRTLAVAGLSVSLVFIAWHGLTRGHWSEAVLGGIALAMSMLPEEFPLVLTIFMAMGAWRISQASVLTRRTSAIETLGAATVLCTDKTGTMTENRMRIVLLQTSEGIVRLAPGPASGPAPPGAGADLARTHRQLLRAGVLASAQHPFDPMDKAFHDLAAQLDAASAAPAGPAGAGLRLERVYALRPDLLAVTQAWMRPDGAFEVAAKGAPEAIADLCGLSSQARVQLRQAIDTHAADGLRLLAVAAATHGPERLPDTPRGFRFEWLGLVGLADPLRPGVADAVRQCHSAGIRVVMITGDHPATARAIARQAGLVGPGRATGGPDGGNDTDVGEEVLTGADLDRLDEAALSTRIASASIFARIMPEQKLRLVEALKASGQIVAMTGDGVNDAPSLKAAHIGIAMGGRGTDVAREAASLVLLDDDFTSIVRTIRLGRRIYDNLRKAMQYILAVHVPIAGVALLPLVFGAPLVLGPIHIAFLEMVIDPVCSVVFEAEEEEADVMSRPPRDPSGSLFPAARIGWSVTQGVLALAVLVAVYWLATRRGLPDDEVRALTFVSLVLVNLALVLVNRSFDASLAHAFTRRNPSLWWVAAAALSILAVALAWPPLAALFSFGRLHGDDLLACAVAAAAVIAALEMLKARWIRQLRRN